MSKAEPRVHIFNATKLLRSWPSQYAFAVVMVAVATALRFELQRMGPFHFPFILFYPAVVLVAMRAGFWPGIMATVLAAISGRYFFVEPQNTFAIPTVGDVVGPALFAIIGVALTVLTASRSRARHALAVSEYELNCAQAVAQIGSWHYDVKAGILRLSDEACRILGRPPGSSIPLQEAEQTLHGEDRDRVLQQWQAAQKSGMFEDEVRVITDGSVRWVHVQAALEWDAHGRPTKAVGVVQDISGRKQAEQALTDSEDRYRDLVEHSEDLVCTHDLEGRLLSVNPAPARLLGYEVAELLKIPMRDLIIPEGREDFDLYLERLRTTGQPEHGLLCVMTRSGEVRTWEYYNSLRTEGVEKPIVRGMAHDVTEKRRAELALVSSEHRYRMLFEGNIAGVAVVSMDAVVLECNDCWAHILGYESAQEICGRKTTEFYVDLGDRNHLLQELEQTGASLGREVRLRRKDGGEVCLLLNCAIRRGDDGQPLIQATVIDISERKQTEVALQKTEQRERARVRELETILDTLPIPVLISRDPECREIIANRAGQEHLGLCPGMNASLSALPDQRPYHRLLGEGREIPPEQLPMQMAAATGAAVRGVATQLVLADGTVKYELGNAAPLVDEHGKVIGVIGAAIDITDQVQAEAALRESEHRMRLAQEVARMGTYERNLITGEGRWSPEMEAIYGLQPGGSPRNMKEFLELIHPEDRDHVAELVQRSMEHGDVQGEWRVIWPDGSVHWIAGRWRAFLGQDEKPVRAIGMDYDITERKKSEEALRQNEERFRVALKDSPITVFNQDRDLRYTWLYNPRSYWRDSMIGQTDEEMLGSRGLRLTALKRQVLQTGVSAREEIEVPHNGANCAFDISIEPLFDADKKIAGITCAAMDIARLHEVLDGLQIAKEMLTQEKSYLESEIQAELGFEEIIGQSAALRSVLKQARVVATTDSTVLLLGETGTGKELVARSIHSLSTRKDKNFIKLNCAAVPSGLLESELFGHEKGAFTGAITQKAGRLELADKGTLFLDEIGELPSELQPKLLRVLQDREFERLGGVRTVKVDVRIISATNRDLQKDVVEKKFREDLFYRLNVFPIELPPLRERRSDIPMLVHHFMRKHAQRMGKHIEFIPSQTMKLLQKWNWPGNIRSWKICWSE